MRRGFARQALQGFDVAWFRAAGVAGMMWLGFARPVWQGFDAA